MRRVFALVAVLAVIAGACTAKPPKTLPPVHASSRVSYVAVGASESVGVGADNPIREAWTQVLYRGSLPTDAVFTNVAVSGATATDALRNQVPVALEVKPTLVTVWLNANDIIAMVAPAVYEVTLQALVHALRRGGKTDVLVANTPPIDDLVALGEAAGRALPAGLAQLAQQRVADYNAAIARVVAAEGAVLVDLHATGVAARADGTEASLISADGFHPSTAGHKAVAATFAAALPDSAKRK